MHTTHRLRKPVESRRALQQRKKTLALGIFLSSGIAGVLAMLLLGCGGGSSAPVTPPPIPTVQALQVADVQNIVQAAVNSVNVDMAVVGVDRAGFVLGVFRTQNAPETATGNFTQVQNANDVAVALARTGAFFSNDQAPLSSRTIRFISGIHFPPGVVNTPNAPLYGIENSNRGCDLNVSFNAVKCVPAARSLNGQPCSSGDATGCGPGILTGKTLPDDSDPDAIEAGGIPLYRLVPPGLDRLDQGVATNGKLVGAIGVV